MFILPPGNPTLTHSPARPFVLKDLVELVAHYVLHTPLELPHSDAKQPVVPRSTSGIVQTKNIHNREKSTANNASILPTDNTRTRLPCPGEDKIRRRPCSVQSIEHAVSGVTGSTPLVTFGQGRCILEQSKREKQP